MGRQVTVRRTRHHNEANHTNVSRHATDVCRIVTNPKHARRTRERSYRARTSESLYIETHRLSLVLDDETRASERSAPRGQNTAVCSG
ncbi:hypothetical protein HMPREF0058_2032 [Actinomyces urogenitalis DSM 15434]|uniref:Uncharacterized protein n=1 Tax=Actinomyces urogenitalis DSM 15434 TaxID=525246 RepID=C0W838_9ACTO|nr:hypothetical protein HMPREF0058_2032 [Actinomyces urogenitalis DSM 15434]